MPNIVGCQGAVTGVVVSKSGVTLLARILGQLGTPITVATISSITWNVQDLVTQLSTGSGSFTPSQVVFDSLQVFDPRWNKDSASSPGPDKLWGYNFLASVPASSFTAYDVAASSAVFPSVVTPHTFQVDVEFTPVSGEKFRQPWVFKPIPTWP